MHTKLVCNGNWSNLIRMGSAFRSGLRNVRLWVFLKANGDQIDRERAHIASEKRRRSKIVMTSFSLASKYVWSPFYRRCSVWNNLLEWDVTFTVFPHFGILFQQLNNSLAQIKDQSCFQYFELYWPLLIPQHWVLTLNVTFCCWIFWQKFCELWNWTHPTGN